MPGLPYDEVFRAAAPWAERSLALARALDEALAAGRAAWPGVHVEDEAFVRFLAARAVPSGGGDAPLAGLHLGDLYLACACAGGDASAVAVFARAFLADLARALSRSGTSALADDVRQILLERFFVPGGAAAPKIAEYGGRGRLASWVHIAAVRTAVSLARARRPTEREAEREAEFDALALAADPELDALRVRYLPDFRRALHDAFEVLTPRDRALLKLHYVDGAPVDRLAALYGVHRVSASRWLSSARSSILAETRRLLSERLSVDAAEFESLAGALQSQLDLSLRRLLGESPASAP